jgi:hypothetical protein
MYFYLDKELAKQNIARCLYKSEIPASDKELEFARNYFKYSGEFLVYVGEDIPDIIRYNPETDIVEKYIPETPIETISEEITEPEEEFGEEDGKTYWYANKEKAIKKGLADTYFTSDRPLLNMYKHFGHENVFCYSAKTFGGKELPYFCTYIPEQDTVREATEYEKFKRNQRELTENEVVIEKNKEIVTLEEGQYINENEDIITVSRLEEAINQKWDKENHVWIDTTTDLDRVQMQYREYEAMDTPSVLKEMEMQDPALATELINMLIELRGMMYSLQAQAVTFKANLVLPKPSEKLLSFKNRFNKI